MNTTIFAPDPQLYAQSRTRGAGPVGKLPVSPADLENEASGNLFGLTQNAGMGWNPSEIGRDQYLILSTQGGLRNEDGSPIALGYHTGHWEIGLLVQAAAERLREEGALPFAAYCSDPCDGRTQGTHGMFDSLPYRNDAATVLRRLIRSLPQRKGLLGIATCDKGLPAMMMALAGSSSLPGVIVPGGVTLPDPQAEDAGKAQTIGARYAHGLISYDYAIEMGCRACASPGGGCQFLGTAATSQVVAEALGIALPHSALCPSGEAVWLDLAKRSAQAVLSLQKDGITLSQILTDKAVENAMRVHAAFGGSTNLLLHIPAIAHAAGLNQPSVDDWARVNQQTPRIVDVLPNGPANHPTVQAYFAGGTPEVMLHLRNQGLLHLDVLTVSGKTLGDVIEWWEHSPNREACKAHLRESDGIDPNAVIFTASKAKALGIGSTIVFPKGNIAPQGSVLKATAIDPSVIDEKQRYHHIGPARVFTSEAKAIKAIKGQSDTPVAAGDVLVLIGGGPIGTGMQETYQLTSALRHIPWGKSVPILTDARFSGVSTGACIGHIGPEALAGGPIGKLRDGDIIEIDIDRNKLEGRADFIGVGPNEIKSPGEAATILASRESFPGLASHSGLPEDTKLWAALQHASGGTWSGCVYDSEKIVALLEAGAKAQEKG